jgi:lysine-N-methylase
MPLPVRALPVVQNWDCHSCGWCCKEYVVHITDDERDRIETQGWDKDASLGGVAPVVKKKGRWQLNQNADKACIFLADDGLCRIHAKFGLEGKPLACRVYPFMLVPAGTEWRVGLRFACPSAAADKGRPVNEHLREVRAYTAALEERTPGAIEALSPPPLQRRQRVSWADLGKFANALAEIMGQRDDPIERRLRKCLALAALCQQAKFDKVTGQRLVQFLDLLVNALDAETPRDPAPLPRPSWVGRIFFRQMLALLARKDTGPNAGLAKQGRLA